VTSDWVKPMFDRAGIKLHTAKTRAFTDLLTAIPEAEASGSVLITNYPSFEAREYQHDSHALSSDDFPF
jgi:hypothetical protein